MRHDVLTSTNWSVVKTRQLTPVKNNFATVLLKKFSVHSELNKFAHKSKLVDRHNDATL